MNAIAEAGYECQVCDHALKYSCEAEKKFKIKGWAVVQFSHEEYDLSIVACPSCSLLAPEHIYENYKKRVLSGRDKRYH